MSCSLGCKSEDVLMEPSSIPRGYRGSPRIGMDATEPTWAMTCGFRTAATPKGPRISACKAPYPGSNRVTLAHQFLGQLVGRLRRPTGQRHRVAPCRGMHQLVKSGEQARLLVDSRLVPAARWRSVGSTPSSTSLVARITVLRLMPAASATLVLPPRPTNDADAPTTTRR